MDNKTILVYDSGIGGLTVLYKLKKVYSQYNFLYLSDSKNAPYGLKSEEELFKLAYDNILRAKRSYDFCCCVVACNTLSTNVLDKLKVAFPSIVFYGVYPFVSVSEFGETLLIGTRSTIKSIYIMKAKNEKKMLDTLDLSDLVLDIERNVFSPEKISLKKYFLPRLKNYKFILLGCTHFNFLKDEIKKVFPKSLILTEMLGNNVHHKGILSTFDPSAFCDLKLSPKNFIFEDKMRNYLVYNFLIKKAANFKKLTKQ